MIPNTQSHYGEPTRPLALLSFALCVLALPLQPTRAQVAQYAFSNFAGAAGEEGEVDGIGSAARFSYAACAAVDKSGNVYVADYGLGNTIRKVSPDGAVTTLAGGGGWGNSDGPPGVAQFFYFTGLAVDNSGNVFVAMTAEIGGGRIRKITPDGVVTTLAGSEAGSTDGTGTEARFCQPCGLAVDGTGSIYVADWGNNTIRKISSLGSVSTFAGQAGQGGHADGTGSAARFSAPSAIALDKEGNLYVTETFNDTVRKISPAGVVTTLAGTAGQKGSTDGIGGSARFNGPGAVALDSVGNVYVADAFNFTIRKISPAGEVSTLAGKAGQSGSADGIGGQVRFSSLHMGCIAVDSADTIYVADSQRILKGKVQLPAPRVDSLTFNSSTFTGRISGLVPGSTVVIESSVNLRDWMPVQTNVTSGITQTFSSVISPAAPAEFFRAKAK